MMGFRITGLAPEPFAGLFDLDDATLAERSICRVTADADFGYPDRVTLTDVPNGTDLLLLNYVHQPARTPYYGSGPVFVSRSTGAARFFDDRVPESLARRPLSLRGFDSAGMMVDASLVEGRELASEVMRIFTNRMVAYAHVHFALRGCYAARLDRL